MIGFARALGLVSIGLAVCASEAGAWGGMGHRTVAAVALRLIPPEKAAAIDQVLKQLEMDNNFVDAAAYPDEFIRGNDPDRLFSSWHFADLPDGNQPFECEKTVHKTFGTGTEQVTKAVREECLFKALGANLAIVRQNRRDKGEAVALAWVMHLVGDMHQPLHMIERARGGNGFPVTYRGKPECFDVKPEDPEKFVLHKVWDDCLVLELAGDRGPRRLAGALAGKIKTYEGRPEVGPASSEPWLAWGNESHALANSVAFAKLKPQANLEGDYITGKGKGLDVVQKQLLTAGIRLAFLLDQNFNLPTQ